MRQRGVVMVFTSNVAAKLVAGGTVKVGKTYKFRGARRNVDANKRTTLALKLPKSALSAIKKALASHKKVKAKITLAFTVPSGIKTSVTKTITLVR